LDSGAVRDVLVPGEGESIEGVEVGKKSIFVQMLANVRGELRRVRPKGKGFVTTTVALPENGQVAIVGASDDRDDVLVTFESLTRPVTLFHVDAKDRTSEVASLPASFDASDVVVEQRFATSSDGTKVPYFLMARKDVLGAGPAPTIQYGYGGFLSAILPTYYSDSARPQQGAFAGPLWVKDGGVLVLSNIRGGSEYGPAWHEAALKANRQRAYDDFFAIGEQLVADGVTTPAQLGAIGRSNGGLLMGVVMTQRPDLYRAIDCGVPLLDMLRFDKLLAGASWTGEYGDPDDPEERKTLEAISPYHNLDPEKTYPRVLFYTSTRDDRVHPGHARKMAAALESMGVPFYYWENIEGGHGGVANQEQAALRIALELLYMKRELGLD
ncbi:MAG: S9 family peptidase, partial [Myxococcales bacterium]|nr:S9 family peptidase [Myxococcales bacterium]